MATAKLQRAERHLADALISFIDATTDCTPDELLEAATIAQALTDAKRRMTDRSRRMRNRMEAAD